jgi:hypothetical protein
MRAWVVRWEGDWKAECIRDPLIALFNPATSAKRIKSFVEMFYAAEHLSGPEKVRCFLWRGSRRDDNPYPAEYLTIPPGVPFHGGISCGHNPLIVARLAEVRQDSETVTWTDDPVPEAR